MEKIKYRIGYYDDEDSEDYELIDEEFDDYNKALERCTKLLSPYQKYDDDKYVYAIEEERYRQPDKAKNGETISTIYCFRCKRYPFSDGLRNRINEGSYDIVKEVK